LFGTPLLMCTPPLSRSAESAHQNPVSMPLPSWSIRSGWPNNIGSAMLRMAPPARSSPSVKAVSGVAFVWSMVSPKMSEIDSFKAPDCM
jgi:hypothetical protein